MVSAIFGIYLHKRNELQAALAEYTEAEERIDRQIFIDALQKELLQLNDTHRSTFLLRFQQNFSIREIAEVLSCSEGTVKSRLFYTVRKLGQKLKLYNPYKTEVS